MSYAILIALRESEHTVFLHRIDMSFKDKSEPANVDTVTGLH